MAMLNLQYEKDFMSKDEKYKQTIHFGLLLAILIGSSGAFAFDAFTQGISIQVSNFNKIGLTFLGGFVAGLLFFVLYLKVFSFPILETLNLLTLSFCIAHLFGRVGCFFAGCCFGKPTNSIFGIIFPIDSLPYNHFHKQIKIFPTQLFESSFILILFTILFLIKSKNNFIIYITSYTIFRFLIEFIRADNRGVIFNQDILSPSQLFSILILTGAIVIIIMRKFAKSQIIET